MECWNTGILEYWNTGILEYWNTGILEYWNTGILEYWNIHISRLFSYFFAKNRGAETSLCSRPLEKKSKWSA